jgi:DNA helicase-2/ATP-dependent DNA helicase PcrA
VANAVIGKRLDVRHRKVLFTDRESEKKVLVGAAPSPEAEAAYVVREIQRKIRDDGRRPREFAILYRSNGQAKLLEEQLRSEGVAYKLVGGQQFFERKEVKDILSYLKLALNRSDEISLRRVINTPVRGVGEASLERLALHARARDWTLWHAVERVDAIAEISESERAGCKELERVVGELRRRLLVDRAPVTDATRELMERIGLKRDIDAGSTSTDHAKRRWGNVESLMNTFARRQIRETDKGRDPVDELAAFLHALTLKFEEGEEETGDMVTLSTLHGSKGLEFEFVYLIGCEEGFIPHQRTLDPRITDATMPGAGVVQASDVEEERRLFYVGVTRARDELVITRCKHRMLRGKPVPRTPSRFLSDVPDDQRVEFDIRDLPAMDPTQMAAQANALLAALDALGK